MAFQSTPLARKFGDRMGPATSPFGDRLGGFSTFSPRAPSGQVQQGLGDLVSQYNTAYGQARSANEQRYQQLLGIADQTSGQRATDIRSDFGEQQSNVMQQLARLGMSNTTIGSTLGQGNQRNLQSALDRSADTLQGTKLGIIERREDKYPDLSSLQSIIAGIGSQYGGGQGIQAMLRAFSGIQQ